MKPDVPNPGSREAIDKGCTCPVLDNGRGRGYYGQPGVFVYTAGCPVHDAETKKPDTMTVPGSVE